MRLTIANIFLIWITPFLASAATTANDTKVYVDGDKVIYDGKITKEANAALFSLLQEQKAPTTWLSIKSKGGEVNAGMELGEFVFAQKLSVEVLDYCISSCANYVFTAAQQRRISNHAGIFFHGGTTGMDIEIEQQLQSMSETERKERLPTVRAYAMAAIAREKQFFQLIGVEQRITYLGQDPVVYEAELGSEEYVGWYYSLEDLEKLGVGNIIVLNPPWQFKQLSDKVKFFKVTL